MEVVAASHPAHLGHDTGRGHPEGPFRVEAVRRGVERSGLTVVDIEAPPVDRSLLEAVHDPVHVEMIAQLSSRGGGAIDSDTVVSSGSWEASLRSAGAVEALVSEVGARENAVGFALCRPPGHHAGHDFAMGFCLFNNVCIAARRIRSRGARVAILDWDVHHGNGTQSIVGGDPEILYVSIHQAGFYPFEGHVGDIESSPGGSTVNIPLPFGTAGDVYRTAWSGIVLKIVNDFDPEWVLISAGFDGHTRDPLAGMNLVSDDYGWMASQLAQSLPGCRTIFALEGGYDATALEESTAATLAGMSGRTEFSDPLESPGRSMEALEECRLVISRYWPIS